MIMSFYSLMKSTDNTFAQLAHQIGCQFSSLISLAYSSKIIMIMSFYSLMNSPDNTFAQLGHWIGCQFSSLISLAYSSRIIMIMSFWMNSPYIQVQRWLLSWIIVFFFKWIHSFNSMACIQELDCDFLG